MTRDVARFERFWARTGALLALVCGLAAVWMATNNRPLLAAASLAAIAVQQTVMAARGFERAATMLNQADQETP